MIGFIDAILKRTGDDQFVEPLLERLARGETNDPWEKHAADVVDEEHRLQRVHLSRCIVVIDNNDKRMEK